MNNINMFSTAIGAAIGGYTQTGENSNAAYVAAGIGVGGAAGYYGAYNTSPLKRAKSATTAHVKSAIAVGDVNGQAVGRSMDEFSSSMDKITRVRTSITSRMEELEDQIRDPKRSGGALMAERLELQETLFQYNKSRVDNVNLLLDRGNKFTSVEEIDEYMRTKVNSKANLSDLRKINSGISFDGAIKQSAVMPGIKDGDKGDFKQIGGTLEEAKKDLYKHFRSLGSNVPDSHRKAKSISDALDGFNIRVRGEEMHINEPNLSDGSRGNKIGVMPLSRWDKGVRVSGSNGNYRDANGSFQRSGTRMVSKGFNPNGLQYLGAADGFGAKEMSLVMDPEEMLAISKSFNDNKGRAGQIKESIKRAHSLQEYIGIDSLKRASEDWSMLAKIKSRSVNVTDHVLKTNKGNDPKTKYNVGKLGMVGTKDQGSEYHQLVQKVGRQFDKNALAGSGINTMDFTDLSKGAVSDPTGLMVSAERDGFNVLFREQQSIGGTTQSAAYTAMGRGDELKHSSQAMRRDVSMELSELFSDAFGSQYSLDDGAMIGNSRDMDKFKSKGRVRFTLANVGTEVAPAYQSGISNLSEIVNSSQAGKQKLLAGLGTIDAGTSLGIGSNGETISLKGYFDHGRLTDVRQTSRGLEMTMDAVADPSKSGWMKIFSQSSKAGVTLAPERQFNAMLAMSKLYEERAIKLEGGNVRVLDHMGIDDLMPFGKSKENRLMSASEFAGTIMMNVKKSDADPTSMTIGDKSFSIKSSLISDWDGGGQKSIGDLYNYGQSAANDFVSKYKTENNAEFLGKYFDKLQNIGGGTVAERARDNKNRANIGRGILAMSDEKSARDIMDTAIEHAYHNNTGLFNALKNAKSDLLSSDPLVKTNARDAVMAGVSRAYGQEAGESLTTFTPNYLEGIHGAGKQGSISWLEQSNLKLSGYTNAMIAKLGSSDQAALYELEMIRSTASTGNLDPSKMRDPASIFGIQAGERGAVLKGIYGDIANPSYSITDLGADSKGVKSVPISLADTGHTGLYEMNEDKSILKNLDKARVDVVKADAFYRGILGDKTPDPMSLRKENLSDARASLSSAISNLVETQSGALTGDNNVLKNAIRMSADNSAIMVARSADGAAARFAAIGTEDTKGMSNKMFVSQHTLKDYSNRFGLDILDADGNIKKSALEDMGNGIKRIKVGGHDKWMAQVSREPVQGAFSSMATELLMDGSLTGGQHHVYSPKNLAPGSNGKNLMNAFAFLDYDADILRVASMHTMDSIEMKKAMKINDELVRQASNISEMQNLMAMKGRNIDPTMISDFGSRGDYIMHQVNSSLKGRHRKPIAPKATEMVASMQESISKHFGPLAPGDEKYGRMIAAREVAHNLTESMLKTAHKSTNEFGAMPSGAVEKFGHLHEQFLKNPSTYGDDFAGGVTDIINKSVGKMVLLEGGDGTKGIFNDAVSDIVNSQRTYASQMSRDMAGVLDGPKYAAGDASDHAEGAKRIAMQGGANGGFVDSIESADKVENLTHRTKSVIAEAKSFIVETAVTNKKKFLGATAVLGTIAAIGGANSVDSERLAASQPSSSQKGLDPIRDRKAYIRKYKESGGYDISANIKTGRDNLNPKTINQALFGDQLSSARVNVTDKSGMF
jgi:hypothetical protein